MEDRIQSRVVMANALYHDRLVEEYETEYEGCYRKAKPRIRATAKWLSVVTGGGFWLDLGCGTGTVLEIAQQFFDDGAGIDISGGMLREARQRGLTVQLGEIESVPYPDGCADVVSAFSVLHHLYDPIQGLREMIRLVKPGGYIYTDWDSNSRALYHPWVLKSVWALRRLLRGRNGFKPLVRDQDAKMRELHRWAEYHHDLRGGLDAEALVKYLRASGMSVELMYYDGNPPSLSPYYYLPQNWPKRRRIKKVFLRAFLGGKWPSFELRELRHRFAILARKRVR